jgi:AraC-like DNA-binding protein
MNELTAAVTAPLSVDGAGERERLDGRPAALGTAVAAKDHAYVMTGGLMYATPFLNTGNILRRCGSISLTAEGRAFEFVRAGQSSHREAMVVKPMVTHKILGHDVPMVTLLVNPLHPMFRMFRGLPRQGLMPLDRGAFAPFDKLLRAAYLGELDAAAARTLFNGVIETVGRRLPAVRLNGTDAKAEHVIALLKTDLNRSLTELAASVDVSYTRMSHLFTKSVGISLRNYQLWLKVHNALNMLDAGATLTEIAEANGFSDLAHLSRVARQALGAPLTHFRGINAPNKIYCLD